MTIRAGRKRDRKWSPRYQVKLDGVLRKRAFYADGRRGVVREFVEDENGNLVYDKVAGQIKKRELRGQVKWLRIR